MTGKPKGLTKAGFNLTSQTVDALAKLTNLTGQTQTDAVNQAVQVYAELREIAASGGAVYVQAADGEQERLWFV